jgi:hypothetical protein
VPAGRDQNYRKCGPINHHIRSTNFPGRRSTPLRVVGALASPFKTQPERSQALVKPSWHVNKQFLPPELLTSLIRDYLKTLARIDEPPKPAAAPMGLASHQLRRLIDTLIAIKRRRAAEDPELFAAYLTLAADAQSVVAAHIDELVGLAAIVIRSGVKEGTFRTIDPVAAGKAVLFATSRFHHPAHAAEWADPAVDVAYKDVWQLLMDGLRVAKRARSKKI